MSYQHPSNIICHIILYNNKTLKWFISLIWYLFKICFHCCVLCDEINKTRSHLHMFSKKKLTHRCFKSSPSNCSNWIVRVNFLHFRPSKIHISPTDVVSFLSPPRCHLFSNRRHHAAVSCHTSFLWSQDELIASASSSTNTSPHHLPSRAETEAIKKLSQSWSLFPLLNYCVSILPPP
jgi:hypothetical protein